MKLQDISSECWKGNSMINCPKEFDLDVLNTFCVMRVWKLKILKRIYDLISAFTTQRFFRFWKPISPRMLLTPKEPYQPFHQITKFLNRYKCL